MFPVCLVVPKFVLLLQKTRVDGVCLSIERAIDPQFIKVQDSTFCAAFAFVLFSE
jgi:hypothetical protein